MNDIPEDFDSDEYVKINKDLSYLNLNHFFVEYKSKRNYYEILNHYIKHGVDEKRLYKYILPNDFDLLAYKKYNPDIEEQNDDWLKWHYSLYGCNEKRLYKNLEIPEDFDVLEYLYLNKDLYKMSIGQIEMHFFEHSKNENRLYKDNLFDKDFFIKYNKIENYIGYKNYFKDISQIKSQKILDVLSSIQEEKNSIILISHDNSLFGATHYLYSLYCLLKQSYPNEKFILIDTYENKDLLQKYQLNDNEVLHYLNDATLLINICKKINPKLIYLNSINGMISQTIPYIKNFNLLFHSHEIKKAYHSFCDSQPDFVVSQRIADEFLLSPKVQPPFLTENELNKIDEESIKDCEISNQFGILDKNKITIGMCGSLTARKNYKLFIEVAKNYPNLNFLWIGGNENLTEETIQNLYHVKSVNYPYCYFMQIDYFILFSIHDPCPYVVLENLYLNNKVITFKENIYTDHKCELLKDLYFEYDGEINFDSVCKMINLYVHQKADRSNVNGRQYILENFAKPRSSLINFIFNTV